MAASVTDVPKLAVQSALSAAEKRTAQRALARNLRETSRSFGSWTLLNRTLLSRTLLSRTLPVRAVPRVQPPSESRTSPDPFTISPITDGLSPSLAKRVHTASAKVGRTMTV